MIVETDDLVYFFIPGSLWHDAGDPGADGDGGGRDVIYVGRMQGTVAIQRAGDEIRSEPSVGLVFSVPGSEILRAFDAPTAVARLTRALPRTLSTHHLDQLDDEPGPTGADLVDVMRRKRDDDLTDTEAAPDFDDVRHIDDLDHGDDVGPLLVPADDDDDDGEGS